MTTRPRPKRIGRYHIDRKLGEGGSGVVYRARDPLLLRDVAIKVPNYNDSTTAPEETVTEAFYHEAAIAGSFTHPNIVTIFDVGRDNDQDYLVMEFVPGRGLNEYLESVGQLKVASAVDIVHKCCIALDYIHFHGIIHRDIKPANIMHHPARGIVKIMDFSVAHRIESKDTIKAIGTLGFMAPEHFDATRNITMLTDLFALGSTLYFLLTGKKPFLGDMEDTIRGILHNDPVPLSKFRNDVPEALERIVLRALAKNDIDRFSSALDFAAALAEIKPALQRAGDRQTTEDPWPPELQYYVRFRRNDWFKHFSPDQIQELLRLGSTRKVPDGETIIAEGNLGRSFFLLVDGHASVVKSGARISTMPPGTCFGETSLMNDAPRTASVIAAGEVLLWSIDAGRIEALAVDSRAALYKTLMEVVMRRLDSRTGELAALSRGKL